MVLGLGTVAELGDYLAVRLLHADVTGGYKVDLFDNAMQDLMAKIRETTDPAEKKRLLGVHMLAMKEQIKTIRSVYATTGGHEHGDEGKGDAGKADMGKGDGGKGDGGKQGGMGMMGEKGMMGGGMMMKKMHKEMEQRMDALEQLLQQFIEHEAVEQGE